MGTLLNKNKMIINYGNEKIALKLLYIKLN